LCNLLDKNVTTYQHRLASCQYFEKYVTTYQKDPQKIRGKKFFTYQKHVLEKIVSTYQKRLVNTLKEDATTYQERLANYLTNMLQRITNILQDT
jgi:hypothetical protein